MKRLVNTLLLIALLTFPQTFGQSLLSTRRTNTRAEAAVRVTLPNKESDVRFLVIGDTGTGSEKQREIGQLMLRYRQVYPYEFVLMMGDNLYGGEKAVDFKT